MIFRNVKIEELDKASKIYKNAFGKVADILTKPIDNIYVLEKENEIVGLCMIDYMENLFRNSKTAYLNSICIDSKYQGQGIGKKLMEQIEQTCKENGVTEIMMTSNSKKITANNLYKKLNYQIYETNMFRKNI